VPSLTVTSKLRSELLRPSGAVKLGVAESASVIVTLVPLVWVQL
jgi:hypothetical protein